MDPVSSRAFAVTNLVANRVVIAALTSPAGPRVGRRLAVVEYRGRRSGRPRRLVTQYATDGKTVRITVGMADHKTWWRNFAEPHPVHLLLAGVDHDVTAHVVRGGDGTVVVVAELEPLTDTPAGG